MSHEETLFWNFFHNHQPHENNTFLPPWIKDQTLPLLNEEGIKAVAAILQAGVSFRQAINDAANGKRELKRQAQIVHQDKLKTLHDKCEEALSQQMNNENDGSYFRHQFVSNAKQYQHEVEQFRQFVSKLETSLSSEAVENQNASSSRIDQARENFNRLCNQLTENWVSLYLKNNNSGEINANRKNRPPWQLNYSAENDPFAPPSSDESKVTFDGGKILDRFGRDVWEDRCYALGATIQSGTAVGVGVNRFRSVSRKNCVKSELWEGWVRKLLDMQQLGSENDESRGNVLQNPSSSSPSSLLFSVQFNVCDKNVHDRQSRCTCTIVDPFLNDVFAECNNQRVMAFLDVCEKVDLQTNKNLQLQTAIVESFKEYKNFPLVGRLTNPKHNNNNNNFHLTYEQVEHQCCLFLEFLSSHLQHQSKNVNDSKLRCIAAIIDDSPEWLILDVACAVVGICFVGLHTCWPIEDLQRAIHEIVEPDLIIYHQRDYNEKILPAATNPKNNNNNDKFATLISFEEIERAGVFVSPSLNSNDDYKKSFTTSILQNEKQRSFFRDSLENNHFDIVENENDNDSDGGEFRKSPTRPFTLMFSSGTSGQLKAVEVSCEAWLQTNFRQQRYQLDPYSVVSFNALAHGLDRGLCWTALFSAGRISFLPSGDKTQIGVVVDEMKEEIVQELIHRIDELDGKNRSSSSSSTSKIRSVQLLPDFVVGSHFCNPSVLVASPDLWTNLKNFISVITTAINTTSSRPTKQAQEIVRILFGNNIKQAATGGAPVAPAVVDFFQKLFSNVDVNSDVPLELKENAKQKRKDEAQQNQKENEKEGDEEDECANFYDVYGATEAPGISTNHQIRGGLEIGLILELPATTTNDDHQQNPDKKTSFVFFTEGELLVRGSGVARKYHNDEVSSKNSFLHDGWYRTGDVVKLKIENENNTVDLEKHFQKLPFPFIHDNNTSSSFFKLKDNATAKLFVVDRVRDFIELYVNHQSAWVPASKVETAIMSKKNRISNELSTHRNKFLSADSVSIEQVAVFGDRMLPFLVAVVGIKVTSSNNNTNKNDEIKNMLNDKCKKQEMEKELAEIFQSISLFQNDDGDDGEKNNGATPSYWIPHKVMLHRVIDDDDELSLDLENNNNAMKSWKSGGEFRTHLGKLKRGVLGKLLRNQLAEYLC